MLQSLEGFALSLLFGNQLISRSFVVHCEVKFAAIVCNTAILRSGLVYDPRLNQRQSE